MNDPDSTDTRNIELPFFISFVRQKGQRLYRDLPWRGIDDAWLVLASEVMLQQTQVARVLKYWQRWSSMFPSADALAAASTTDALELWQGLGYNRRALALKRAAEICSSRYAGAVPCEYDELLALPGVGQATAAGVCIFAFQQPQVYLETNIRTVFLHHFFKGREGVRDSEIVPFVKMTCDTSDPRGWYYALLDYGSELKRLFPNPSRCSAHHARQSVFEGSLRQKRAFVVREVLAAKTITLVELLVIVNHAEQSAGRDAVTGEELEAILKALAEEGFLQETAIGWSIAE